jgi:hypothetical protein
MTRTNAMRKTLTAGLLAVLVSTAAPAHAGFWDSVTSYLFGGSPAPSNNGNRGSLLAYEFNVRNARQLAAYEASLQKAGSSRGSLSGFSSSGSNGNGSNGSDR